MNAAPSVAPYGSWRSPVSAQQVAAGGVSLRQVVAEGEDVYWIEGRPKEGGRNVVVRRTPAGEIADLTPVEINVRTRVHEYGGGDFTVLQGTLFYSSFADQRLYRQDPGQPPRPITPEPAAAAGLRYADARVTPDGRALVCVREVHGGKAEARNEVIWLPADGSGDARVLASGDDFYASPRLSADGRRLAFLAWNHPNMPWDGTMLRVGNLGPDGRLRDVHQVAGGESESIFQPEWGPDGALYFVSDRTGWWNLYRLADGTAEALAPMAAEFGLPQWVFGQSTYTFLPDGRLACVYSQQGFDHLALVDSRGGGLRPVATSATTIGSLHAAGTRLAGLAGSPTEPLAVALIDPETGAIEPLRRSTELRVDPKYVSPARPITFPTEEDREAHALFYPPRNADFVGPAGERPPLLVISHGGPTAQTSAELRLSIQYWTSRGIAVVDVNYGGSTGYGRAYRERLKDAWGIVDVADCINAARYLAQQGEVDDNRLMIRGGSAGGYTTLCALTFSDAFTAGASYYGVADLGALARETHKFESRYLDGLIGPYPEREDLYRERSPINYADRLSAPLILFQGLEDKVVPPDQAETMVAALQAKGLPYAYLAFAGEQHGFRRAETIQRTLEAELSFYAQVFGFPLADPIESVKIENLPPPA